MGVSTDGQICFGIVFEDGHEFPWGAEEFEDDLEAWWQHVNGYKRPFEIYTPQGEYIGGVKPDASKFDEYFAHEREWNERHPAPVTLVNYCSGDCPMYILAVPSSCKECSRGYPEELDLAALIVTDSEKAALIEFCRKHEITTDEGDLPEPKWWLSSYWG